MDLFIYIYKRLHNLSFFFLGQSLVKYSGISELTNWSASTEESSENVPRMERNDTGGFKKVN